MPTRSFAKILAHSINESGNEIISYHLRYPRIVHSQVMAHRSICKNGASTRAIPTAKMIEQANPENRYVPDRWFEGRSGMQPGARITSTNRIAALERQWNRAAENAITSVMDLAALGVEKETLNRLLEPFLYMDIIATSTNWSNFHYLRVHEDAQWAIQEVAGKSLYAKINSVPKLLKRGEAHAPYLEEFSRLDISEALLCCAGKIARVSYARNDEDLPWEKQLELGKRMRDFRPLHASAFDHLAYADPNHGFSNLSGGLYGYVSYRKCMEEENHPPMTREQETALWEAWCDKNGV